MKKETPTSALEEEVLIAALEDRVPFESFQMICGLMPDEVRKFMRARLNKKKFVVWQNRVRGSVRKNPKKRDFFS